MKSIIPSQSSAGLTVSRRRFLRGTSWAALFLTVPGAFAEELTRPSAKTARVSEGPFYPPKLPLDTDNDLILINDSLTPAIGEIVHLSGRLLDAKGDPIRNAAIEIWEADHSGVYLADQSKQSKYDANFQGFGRFLTGSTGEYYFRALKPACYPGRQAPHIHFKVKVKGRDPWTTQLFIKGHPGNQKDSLWRSIGDQAARDSVTVDFKPLPGSRAGELSARFDLMPGITPEG
jgi:protocatechuate 3,4-dioxygenase beta subunit